MAALFPLALVLLAAVVVGGLVATVVLSMLQGVTDAKVVRLVGDRLA
jgi:uncharacterized integral membrane protein